MTATLYAREDRGSMPVWHRVRQVRDHGSRITGACGHGFEAVELTGKRPSDRALCLGCLGSEQQGAPNV